VLTAIQHVQGCCCYKHFLPLQVGCQKQAAEQVRGGVCRTGQGLADLWHALARVFFQGEICWPSLFADHWRTDQLRCR
jgi:hypothetical protein